MADNPRIDELKRRVQQDPASIAFAALADEYRRAGLFHDAIETCRAGLQRHPAYLSARVTLGRALLEIGEFQEATEHLEQVLRAAPENLAAIRALAEIHRRNGEPLETAPEEPPAVPVPSKPAPLKPVAVPADKGMSSSPVLSTPVIALKTEPEPAVVVTTKAPSTRSLVIEDLELFLTGIDRARQSIGA